MPPHDSVEPVMETKEVLDILMRAHGVSARELAKRTGMNRSTISAILSGTNESPRDKTLQPIAEFFDVSLAQLRGYDVVQETGSDYVVSVQLRERFPVVPETAIRAWLAGSIAKQTFSRFVRSAHPKGDRCFVFIAKDEALSPIIGVGGMAFVDPDFRYPADTPVQGKRIALVAVEDHFSYRIESEDLGETIFKPADPAFRTLRTDECEFVGYVVGIPEENWLQAPEDRQIGERLLKENDR